MLFLRLFFHNLYFLDFLFLLFFLFFFFFYRFFFFLFMFFFFRFWLRLWLWLFLWWCRCLIFHVRLFLLFLIRLLTLDGLVNLVDSFFDGLDAVVDDFHCLILVLFHVSDLLLDFFAPLVPGSLDYALRFGREGVRAQPLEGILGGLGLG